METVKLPKTAEIVIVGSGPAGATAARTLARAGKEVVVLESGGDFSGMKLTQRDGEMYDQLYSARGGRTTSDMLITVLHGRALGGGSVINASDVVPIPDGVLRFWQKRFGLSDYNKDTLAPFVAQALEDLSVNTPTEAQLNRNNRLLRDGTLKLGLRGEVMQHNRVGCAGLGTCLIGCPLDAKRNARVVAIPQAMEAGARFVTRAKVVRIGGSGAGLKTIDVELLDDKGYQMVARQQIEAKIVILAAGAISTPQLLLRSGLGNEHTGQNLMLQPQLPLTAMFPDKVRMFDGIPQSYAVTEYENLDDEDHGWWGFRIEAIGGTPGIVATMNPDVGEAGKAWMQSYDRVAASLLLVPDGPNGRIEVESNGRMHVHYDMPDEQKARYRKAARTTAAIYLAAGAEETLVPSWPPVSARTQAELQAFDNLELRPASVPMISAHQMGSVRMAPDAKNGATAPDGALYGTKGIYVLDSSLFPSSASSHIMAPIMTVAGYLSAKIAVGV